MRHRDSGVAAVLATDPRAQNEMRADPEYVGEDEILGQRFTQDLGSVLHLRVVERLKVLRPDLPNDVVVQPRKQIGKAQADLPGLPQVIPR